MNQQHRGFDQAYKPNQNNYEKKGGYGHGGHNQFRHHSHHQNNQQRSHNQNFNQQMNTGVYGQQGQLFSPDQQMGKYYGNNFMNPQVQTQPYYGM